MSFENKIKIALHVSPKSVWIKPLCDALRSLSYDCLNISESGFNDIFDLLITDAADSGLISAAKSIGKRVFLCVSYDDAEAVVKAFSNGVDDYCFYPSSIQSMVLRIEILLQRCLPEKWAAGFENYSDFSFDLRHSKLYSKGKHIALKKREFDLALTFFRNMGNALSRVTLQETLWDNDFDDDSRTVDMHVSRVRKKLNLETGTNYNLRSIYGYGYILEAENF